ncbi:MAG: hypothetical protein NUV80_04540 [Candidatus Berkelbacteria bacterium]|nr:hypothetical protein [Candidatus Berkelbacteria bacterium]MCR4307807.1 hypothetical protein [Candidatus Berkelbacteria bacterium]
MEKTPGPKPRTNVFGFFDETGVLHTPTTDKVFALGLLVCQQPRELHRSIVAYKNSQRYFKEFKFTDIRDNNLGLYRGFIDLVFGGTNNRFISIVYDKQLLNMSDYNHDHERAYSMLAAQVISHALGIGRTAETEYIAILADDISTSKSDRFEKIVKDKVHQKLRRNAVFGIARLESHAISEIQLCDVLVGTVAYAFKVKYGVVKGEGAKLGIVKHLQKRLGLGRLSQTFQKRLKGGIYFSVEEYDNKK